MHFCLPSMNGIHAKAKSESFTAASSRCDQNLKNEYLPNINAWQALSKSSTNSMLHVQHNYFSSFSFLSTLPNIAQCMSKRTCSPCCFVSLSSFSANHSVTDTHLHMRMENLAIKSVMQWRKLMFLSGQNMALYGLQSIQKH